MKTLKTFLLAITLVLMAAFQACDDISLLNQDTILTNLKKFDVDLFEQNIQAGLGTQWVGYAYVINHKGNLARSGTFGKWTQGVDGNISANIDTDIYAASVNKMITAVAFLKVVQDKGFNVNNFLNQPIELFLPPAWTVDPLVAQLTFRQLLQHRTGFNSSIGADYNSLKNAVQTTPGNFSYQYANANFGLMRILMYRLIKNQVLTGTDEEMDAASVKAFADYVQDIMFNSVGIEGSLRSSKARYYRWGDPAETPGWDIGNRSDRLGSGGWYLSPQDLAKFLAYVNHSETLISKTTRDLMYSQFLGWSDGAAPSNTASGDHGVYYSKGGSLCNAGADNSCSGQGVRNIVVSFPGGVELVIMANNRGNNMSLTNMAFTAFDNAWK
jgi:CubicO group peptidase (beta-lactamase class C family)